MKNDISPELYSLVERINNTYETLSALSNDELRAQVYEIEDNICNSIDKKQILDDYLVKVYAIVKETARRFTMGDITVLANDHDKYLAENYDFVTIRGENAIYKNEWSVCGVLTKWAMIHYDEQLLGGILLHRGYATEMATGEGKTLVATLPIFLNALTHEGVHLMTVNDYLSKRDFEITRPIYMLYGLSTDCIENYSQEDFSKRKQAYKANITFGTNSGFTFDYLRDHLTTHPSKVVQQQHNFAIIDELDSILIDGADEPHIVGGGNYYNHGEKYRKLLPLVKEFITIDNNSLYQANKLNFKSELTPEGEKWFKEKTGISNLYEIYKVYEIANFETLPTERKNEILLKLDTQNVIHQLLLALTVYERDVDYAVTNNKIKIIDPHTGRIKENSRWEHGLHTAIEVKENVTIEDDFDGMAVISLKNYFRLYKKVSGMSGTIITIKEELEETYNLKCAALPTHKPIIRQDLPLRVFRTAEAKNHAIIATIKENIANERPTLVGCLNIKKSDEISCLLNNLDIKHNKLDARTIKDEANIIAKAGIGTTITVSTSVAGRGTDIKPSKEAINNGGLLVIGAAQFDSIRIDCQLKGRTGRQGDPGTSIFFTSLEDVMVKNLSEEDFTQLAALVEEIQGEDISTPEIIKLFNKAQLNREEYFKKLRAETARKDDIIAPHRKKFYNDRNKVLFDATAAEDIVKQILNEYNVSLEVVTTHLSSHLKIIKDLCVRHRYNNPDTSFIYIAFADNMHTFAIILEIDKVLANDNYFLQEFKRQTILQVYDKEWKKLVLHIMSDLDKKEIGMLDERYQEMMNEIHSVILSRLTQSTIPISSAKTKTFDRYKINEASTDPKNIPTEPFPIEELCPCGSGKKYYECHGNNTRSNISKKRRR